VSSHEHGDHRFVTTSARVTLSGGADLPDENYDCANVTRDTPRDSFSRRRAALSGHG
jgi:hypothetical protein